MGSIIRDPASLLCLAFILGVSPSQVSAQGYWFLRGDANDDLKVDLADPATVLSHLFFSTGIVCDDAADGNDDGDVNIADSVYVVDYLFLGGAGMPLPGDAATGPDPTEDPLTCDGVVAPVIRPQTDHILSITDVSGESGTTQLAEIFLEIPAGSSPASGWSLTVTTDPTIALPLEVVQGTGAADLFTAEILDASTVVMGAVVDFFPPFGGPLLTEGVHPLATIELDLVGAIAQTSALAFQDDPIDTITVIDGFAYDPVIIDGLITIAGDLDVAFTRGECNGDGTFDIGDAVFSLQTLFVAGSEAPPCVSACDANDDGGFDVGDPVAVLSRLFILGTGPLPDPGEDTCGVDPTADSLECDAFPACP